MTTTSPRNDRPSAPPTDFRSRLHRSAAKLRRRYRERWREFEWPVVWAAGLLALGLGCYGFYVHLAACGEASLAHALYFAAQLFTLESGGLEGSIPWSLHVARWLAPGVAVYTASKALLALFADQLQPLRARRLDQHTIVCGLGPRGWELAADLIASGEPVCTIDPDPSGHSVQRARQEGMIVLTGALDDARTLERAGIARASRIVALTDDDTLNLAIAARCRTILEGRPTSHRQRPAHCLVHISQPRLCELLRRRELQRDAATALRIESFCEYEMAARNVFLEHPAFALPSSGSASLLSTAAPAVPEAAMPTAAPVAAPPHMVIVGFGRLGQSLAVVAARMWAAVEGPRRGLLRMTVIDPRAESSVVALLARYPLLKTTVTICAEGTLPGDAVFDVAAFLQPEPGAEPPTAIYVCIPDESDALRVALVLSDRIDHARTELVVRVSRGGGLGAAWGRRDDGSGDDHLDSFRVVGTQTAEALLYAGVLENLAMAIQQIYLDMDGAKRRRRAADNPESGEPVPLQERPWSELPEEFRESCRLQADDIGRKVRALGARIRPLGASTDFVPENGLTQDEIERLAEMEHERWMSERLAAGWLPGPAGHRAERLHENLLPWSDPDLSEQTKDIDRRFVREIPRLLAQVGFGITRARS